MYINESRPNIWLISQEPNDLLTSSFSSQRYNDNTDFPGQPVKKQWDTPSSPYHQGYPQPIIIGPNPLPPIIIGGWGSQQQPYPMYPSLHHPNQHQPQQDMAPTSPPPSFTPQKEPSSGPGLKAIDPGGIKGCQYRFVYIWPMYGPGYWMFLTYVGKKSIAGYRWNGRHYVYGGVDLNAIESFQCY
ncbi:MAG: hypothetical protein ACRCST_13790 [Turicibacter sp.]